MKKIRRLTLYSLSLLFATFLLPQQAKAQQEEIQQLLLNVQKLNQLRQILSDMKQGYQLISKGYGTVVSLSEGNFSLHETFLDGLLAVNPAVRHYRRVADIISCQRSLLAEYQRAYDRFRREDSFTPDELAYLSSVYGSLFQQSLRLLDELTLLLTAGELRMSDGERMQAIDRIHAQMQERLVFLRHFNRQVTLVALQRKRELEQVQVLQKLHSPQD
ncbi:TerB family tellurite resistance protein [Pontibacter qinzhouensis]|uniref:TerB family tellurite resistance protein n=1 Tax=Pontibacter qinzhouensis TaxID=2603253 RepID=A0A5C8J472_9BACT|nr:TerB family tellurite resistance protein [Pontibacter qinzhouensis]TXK31128.1 TerB family tellurite resistance protein [Pontibacter qinzhouensis]